MGSKRFVRALLVVALSAALVLLGFLAGANRVGSSATPRVVTGRITLVGVDGNEFAITPAGSKSGASYGLSTNTPWRDPQLVWNSGSPIPCMRPLSHGQTVTIGVVKTKSTSGAPGTAIVTWVECTL